MRFARPQPAGEPVASGLQRCAGRRANSGTAKNPRLTPRVMVCRPETYSVACVPHAGPVCAPWLMLVPAPPCVKVVQAPLVETEIPEELFSYKAFCPIRRNPEPRLPPACMPTALDELVERTTSMMAVAPLPTACERKPTLELLAATLSVTLTTLAPSACTPCVPMVKVLPVMVTFTVPALVV